MKNLFEPVTAGELKGRIAQLRHDSERQWGVMNPAQAMAHCSGGMETAVGDRLAPRMLLGRLIGKFVKPRALGNDKPLRRNSPTTRDLIVRDERILAVEQKRLCDLIDRFFVAGRQGCTTHPHSFFGHLTPEEWAELMYKHMDHHLRQFDV
jgi:hypothetical protein